jgi:hypothetical protein
MIRIRLWANVRLGYVHTYLSLMSMPFSSGVSSRVLSDPQRELPIDGPEYVQ